MKKFLTLLVVAFVVWYVYTNPASAADAVQGIGGFFAGLFTSIQTFLTQLIS